MSSIRNIEEPLEYSYLSLAIARTEKREKYIEKQQFQIPRYRHSEKAGVVFSHESDRQDILKEALAGAANLSNLLIALINQMKDSVKQKGQ
ncbi:MAG: hypothetical protein HLUCCA11_22470 [Phormidesmis priestleyi Ana]|uniref:Uncharacterized protein n=1 Tax=Phormidesmis priestleyi Ana TaxID=1666911 RepID=A0A0P8D7G5_9CYAN|nr:MAG: hypothetical protein HLUCCA11_22470 [Phormidesmis priestleyi Ana]